ncbi:hypothetical protein PSTG_03941 [Puccinia striiformis f. sp. tritici PST-78]|uniref:Uncharacterized protein n=1 Tax=Puccinia striiformis f. sp. tritici PST-78 TaxID=1165861 RepID=A0A0L0VUQ6_9BASI|nr:hypothetical protein PSTG_03941 [Puccinia striiformis f. sp. tritici PST-78]
MQLVNGLSLENFERVSLILKDFNYAGPLAVGFNQTVCLRSLRAHNGFLVGAQDGDLKFDSLENLKENTNCIILKKSFCSKLQDKETSTDIIETHKKVLHSGNQAGMKIVLISSDSAANELSAQFPPGEPEAGGLC